jgi:hypothetical protein
MIRGRGRMVVGGVGGDDGMVWWMSGRELGEAWWLVVVVLGLGSVLVLVLCSLFLCSFVGLMRDERGQGRTKMTEKFLRAFCQKNV